MIKVEIQSLEEVSKSPSQNRNLIIKPSEGGGELRRHQRCLSNGGKCIGTKTSRKSYQAGIRRDQQLLEILGYFHWYRRTAQQGRPVDIGRQMIRVSRRSSILFGDLTIPWERRTDPFKAYWITHAIGNSGFRWYALTLRLGEKQIERCSHSPYGFLQAFSRRLGQILDPNNNPFWISIELTLADGTPAPHIHGLIGVRRVPGEIFDETADRSAIANLKEQLSERAGAFYKPRAVCLKPVWYLTHWISYCSKNAPKVRSSTAQTTFYFPRSLMQAGRNFYNDFREAVRSSDPKLCASA